ncbi:MAG TPA: valine--tRNA ligase [Candidatus Andersenbacteria bacterium]|nr:MAG: Valyl-tRNA synthetase ValS [Parcubacteria group bacterium GW2011_GWA2_45_14]OGY33529.1 MAG: valine--tRNA ligase [Candidatus Andersenbacteria bacterium RIFCSPHIGHO2_02_FULL_46_16]OGY36326.1 MAG: valine--tRNA ligase [Candidatus Andersenbacteria bacterium RIFCSPLOWO2_02_FULL_46_11]HBE90515.1 valine--tRNA ligase [Candidatus Andersenbacteria bacterium]
MAPLPKQYDPLQHEPAIYKKWEESNAFKPNNGQPFKRQDKKPFTIMLPLPNITGSLHMGHALQYSIMDVLIRYHRMKGDPTLWQPGTDHAGIATQNVVEKSLRNQGISRHDLGREKFLAKVWEWREEYGNQIIQQMKRLGSSCDWSRLVFTMDDKYMRAVQEAFVRYYEQGIVYRGNRIINWCPRCTSVISDLEINHVEQASELYTIAYPFSSQPGHISVATTRPETMLGDTAIAVHPADKRYKKLVGEMVIVPLINRPIPIIADERIDQSFGTGAVKVTPAHDPLDAEIGNTHKLPIINVIGEDGRLTNLAGAYANLPLDEARLQIINELDAAELLIKTEPYRHSITLCDRCSTPIQPLISRQWFVDMSKLKGATTAVAEQEIIKFFPPRWKKHFINWMDNVHDWTISRQLWWGQRIPAWWKEDTRGTAKEEGNFVVSIDPPEGDGWLQDPDVFDTWFSSALWPMATLGWPDNTADLKTFYPTSVLISGRDIIYLWIARMIFSGLNFMEDEKYARPDQASRIPFEHVFIHPTVLTKTGQRMSKSLGTGIDPLELVDEYGADATRFGLLHQISYDNQAIKFDPVSIRSGRNFANKIWNIARFLESIEDRDQPSTYADHWIQQRIQQVAVEVTGNLESYKVGEAARLLYDFIWHDLADWYLEILKVQGDTKVAHAVFRDALILMHPFLPHITELLWSNKNNADLLISHPWITNKASAKNPPSLDLFQDIINTVRSARRLLDLPTKSVIDLYISQPSDLAPALQTMTHSRLVDADASSFLKFPLIIGGVVGIGSSDITADSIEAAAKKLDNDYNALITQQTKYQQILRQMTGKASSKAITAKKQELALLAEKLSEIDRSRHALQGH